MPSRAGYIDITHPIRSGMRVYPGDPDVLVELVQDTRRGDATTVRRLRLGTHTGSHADARCHLPGLRGGIEELPLAKLIGPALVVRTHGGPLGPADLPPLGRTRRVLFRGGSTLLPDAARRLVTAGVGLVGTDGLSIDPPKAVDLAAHRVLLRAGVVLIESLDLSRVRPGRYDLIALPLLVPGADGAPVRAVLRRRPDQRRRK